MPLLLTPLERLQSIPRLYGRIPASSIPALLAHSPSKKSLVTLFTQTLAFFLLADSLLPVIPHGGGAEKGKGTSNMPVYFEDSKALTQYLSKF